MAYPTKYTRQYGFQGYQDANPSRPLPGDKVDYDLNVVALSSDEVVEFLKLHTRSDGLLKNGVVSMDSLGADVLSAIALGDANAQASAVAVTPAGGITATNVQDALEELDAALAGAGAVSSVFGRTGAVTATAGDYTATQVTNTPAGNIAATTVQAALNELDTEKQPLDADLTALAALAATAGMVSRTGAGAFAVRTITAPAAGITVSNGTGAAGDPTLALANDLSALEALASTGLAARTGTDTWAQRSVAVTAANGGIAVTNGNGVSGNPTLNLHAMLENLAGLTTAADRGVYWTALNTSALFTLTSAGRALIDDADAAAQRATLGLVIGTNVQAYDAELAAIAGLTSAADSVPYFTGSGTAALATLTSAGRALLDDADAAAQRVTLGVRDVLTAARNYYVRTDGSDSNTGLVNNSGGAFLTIQKAVDAAAAIDTSIYNVTINVADGTYTGSTTLKPITGAGSVTIRGNTTTPSNVLISTTSANCFYAENAFGIYLLRGMKMQTTTSGSCIVAAGITTIYPYEVEFGAVATNNYHVTASRGAVVYFQTAYSITGGAYSHIYASTRALVQNNSLTITLSGTFAFTYFARADRLGYLLSTSITFTGTYTVTGARYLGQLGAIIETGGGGASYFPGNSAGSVATNAYYN